MLTVQNLSKSYGLETVFTDVSFTLNEGERLGLVGPNGCGKTTLLRILTGEEKPDSGVVRFNPSDVRLGYLPQGFQFDPSDTIGGFINRMEGDPAALERRLEALAGELASDPGRASLQEDYDHTLARLALAAQNEDRAKSALAALGLGDFPAETPAAYLSGGQKTRLALAGVLLSAPHLLLLDEPTNHLDIAMLEWLEDWLNGFPHAVLIVSHDRVFLDRTATGILEMDPLTRRAKAYEGSYSSYVAQKAAERERQQQAWSDQQTEIARLKGAAQHVREIARFHKGGKADSGDKFAKGFFANRSLQTVRRAKNIEARIERLTGEDAVEKPGRTWEMKVEFGETPASGRDVIVMENLSVGYGEKVLLSGINLTLRAGRRTVLTGENGAGKTTLLRTITGQIPPLAGKVRLGSSVRPGYMAQEQENLLPDLNALESITRLGSRSETEVRAFLSKFLFKGDDVFVPVKLLSYGQRSRLSLACLAAQGCNLLLLDEPINHLDIPARSRFEEALSSFEGTVLAVVHDRYFIDSFATEIWQAEGGTVRQTWSE